MRVIFVVVLFCLFAKASRTECKNNDHALYLAHCIINNWFFSQVAWMFCVQTALSCSSGLSKC